MDNLVIREATNNDLAMVANLFTEELSHHIELLPERFQPADPIITPTWYQEILENPDKTLFVAELDGLLVGLLLLLLKRSPADPIFKPRLYASVDELVVSENYRGQGIGRRLMTRARQWAAERQVVEIELDVWEKNRGAIALYEKLGYQVIRRRMRLFL